MTREIERLLVRIVGDGNQLTAELKKADKETDGFAARARAGLNSGTKALIGFGAAATTVLGGTAAAIFSRTAADIDRIAKSGNKLDIPTKRLSGLELAAEKSGVGINQLNTGLQRMTRRIAEAARGGGEAQGAIRELGLDARKLAELSPDQQFERIGDALEGIGGQSDKVRLGFRLFDAEGVSLINTLEGGSEALRATQAEADALGLTLSEFDTGRVERANDAVLALERSSTGLARQFTAATAPLVEAIATVFVESQGDISTWRATFESATDFAQSAVVNVVGAWLRLDSAADFVIGKIVRGWALTIKGAALFFNAVGAVEEKLGFSLAGRAGAALDSLGNEASVLADEFDESSVRTAGSIDRITNKLNETITTARRAQRAASTSAPPLPPPPPEPPDTRDRDRLAKELATLQRSLLSKRELIEADLEDRLSRAREFRANELLDEQGHAELIAGLVFSAQSERTELEQREADRRTKIREAEKKKEIELEKKARENRFRIATSVASGLTAIGDTIVAASGRQSKAALAAQKGFAIAAIAVNTAVGASRAIAELGPIAGPIAAAAIIAGGVASTARVVATQVGGSAALGGRGRGGGGAGGAVGIGDGDVCGAVSKVDQCRGGRKEGSDGRLGSEAPTFQILQIGDDNVDRLIGLMRERIDGNDVVLFSGDSQQAQEARG